MNSQEATLGETLAYRGQHVKVIGSGLSGSDL